MDGRTDGRVGKLTIFSKQYYEHVEELCSFLRDYNTEDIPHLVVTALVRSTWKSFYLISRARLT
jgi:hypothetical protein